MQNVSFKTLSPDETEFTVIDVETTGLSADKNKIIEVGLVKVVNLKITDTYRTFLNPGTEIPSSISLLTGITNSDVKDAPRFDEVAQQIEDFIGDSILVGHNLRFDYAFLKNEFTKADLILKDYTTLCTLKLSRKALPQLRKKSLGDVRKHLRIRHKNVHRALGDATVTAKVLVKLIKKLKDEFDVNTSSELLAFQSLPKTNKTFRIVKKKLAEDFNKLPDKPGVYFFKNTKDKIFYIGKAKSLRTRVNSYFSSAAPRKTKKIIRMSSRLGFNETKSELTALLAEAELIKIHKPPLNTLLKRYSQNYFINIYNSQNFPLVKVTTHFDFDGSDYFGPYSNRVTANKMVEIIDRTFRLRECNDKEFNKNKRCYLADIERCLAPCVDLSVLNSYKLELEKVYDYLSGKNQFAVDRLLRRMKQLSEQKKYEEAAIVRDTVDSLLNQLNKSSILAEPINKAKVLFEIHDSGETDFILLLEGKVYIKDYFVDTSYNFEDIIQGYFNHDINLIAGMQEKDLEKMKISLSWLVKNRAKVEIHYLKNFNTAGELFTKLKFSRNQHQISSNIK